MSAAVDHDVPGVSSDYTKSEQVIIDHCNQYGVDMSNYIDEPTIDTVWNLVHTAFLAGRSVGHNAGIDSVKDIVGSLTK